MKRSGSILSPSLRMKQIRHSADRAEQADDATLFARFIDGDDTAFMDLFNRHTTRLYLYCLKFLNNRQSASDIMQDLWERVIRFRALGKPAPYNPPGFLLRMAHNLCVNHLRDRREYASLDELPEWRHPGSSGREMSELEEAVVIALAQLPTAQREILVLNAYSGYRFDEIAEMLGEPVGSVRVRAWRARIKLGKIIAAIIGLKEEDESTGGNTYGERQEES